MSSNKNTEEGNSSPAAELPTRSEPPRTKPLPSLLVDVAPDEHDTEMDVLLPYFTKRFKDSKKKRMRKIEKETEEEEPTSTQNEEII
ncbi:hypothetical protein TRFO_05234 [Tritrichomonas foetus]|uniref:Uncharacterized protein n=1 Tax=Tritrichomonas foetus TaxID=1144522 RepID=A0A1J4KD02_9EUKA|nr:hypothetical protein TRFO_05234 [Tritrichomonas foetus]|eukprot:OHT07580.1 hypothetical protein TRFO_05234 [Tritrichomonas foetus]